MLTEANAKEFDIKYKVLLLGDTLVGKTSLQRAVSGSVFRPDIGSTIGMDFVNRIFSIEKAKVNLQIWDTAGQRNFRTIGRSYYAATKAFVLVYDVTNVETFRLIEHFNQLIEQAKLDTERRYLIANKIDLVERRQVDEETGRRFAARNSMIYFETSCKTGENIGELFEQIASDLVRAFHPKLLDFKRPIVDNFAFNYGRTLSGNSHEVSVQPVQRTTENKKKNLFSFVNYDSVQADQRSKLHRLFCCCC